jgi:molybdopterin synthase sulfur carrier subunit
MARVLMFGRLADAAGWRERVIEAGSLSALTARLTAEDPALGEALAAKGVQIALDQTVIRGDAPLTPASEVAYLPPMSGG